MKKFSITTPKISKPFPLAPPVTPIVPEKFGPIMAEKSRTDSAIGSIMGRKTKIPKLPKITKKLKSYL